MRSLRLTVLCLTAVVAVLMGGCADQGARVDDQSGGARTLVVDNSFDLKTADPGRQYEPTGAIIAKAVYETLLTFNDDDLTKPVPQLAQYSMSDDNRVLTLTMEDGHYFSSGREVTVDDAIFSLNRVKGMKANPSFLLDGVTIAKVDDRTLTLTSEQAAPQLPYLLANTSLAVVDAEAVKAHGGTTDESDQAESFLNQTSAGSGPYQLESYDVASQVVLTLNPHYSGPKPAYGRVVIRNVQSATQQMNVQGGQSHIALDLSPAQAKELDGKTAKVAASPSETVVFLLLNQDPAVNQWTANPDFLAAVRHAIDYGKLARFAGEGAIQAAGVIPNIITGGLPSSNEVTTDLEAAKASLAKSGYDGTPIELAYANDLSVKGIELQLFAVAIQEELKQVGIKVNLKPAPVATELDAYRNGKEEIGLWYWNPDYFHPASYLVFAPGEMVGLRAGWKEGADPTVTAAQQRAATATGDDVVAAYEALQRDLNATGPFIPLVQPPRSVGYSATLTQLALNPVWTIDVAKVK